MEQITGNRRREEPIVPDKAFDKLKNGVQEIRATKTKKDPLGSQEAVSKALRKSMGLSPGWSPDTSSLK